LNLVGALAQDGELARRDGIVRLEDLSAVQTAGAPPIVDGESRDYDEDKNEPDSFPLLADWDVRLYIEQAANAWLEYGGAHPRVWWRNEVLRPGLKVVTFSLVGMLATQLVSALTSPLGIALCASCQLPFDPQQEGLKRRPRRGRNTYCKECAAGPDGDRRRNLGAKRLYAKTRRQTLAAVAREEGK
jgi:hypothetical protein